MVVFSSTVVHISPELCGLLPGARLEDKLSTLSTHVESSLPSRSDVVKVTLTDDSQSLSVHGDWQVVSTLESLLELWMNDLQSQTQTKDSNASQSEQDMTEQEFKNDEEEAPEVAEPSEDSPTPSADQFEGSCTVHETADSADQTSPESDEDQAAKAFAEIYRNVKQEILSEDENDAEWVQDLSIENTPRKFSSRHLKPGRPRKHPIKTPTRKRVRTQDSEKSSTTVKSSKQTKSEVRIKVEPDTQEQKNQDSCFEERRKSSRLRQKESKEGRKNWMQVIAGKKQKGSEPTKDIVVKTENTTDKTKNKKDKTKDKKDKAKSKVSSEPPEQSIARRKKKSTGRPTRSSKVLEDKPPEESTDNNTSEKSSDDQPVRKKAKKSKVTVEEDTEASLSKEPQQEKTTSSTEETSKTEDISQEDNDESHSEILSGIDIKREPGSEAEPLDGELTRLPEDESDWQKIVPLYTGKLSEDEYQCLLCQRSTTSLSYLQLHIRRNHFSRKHKCKTCGSAFSMEADLRTHEKLHLKKFSCDICSQKFATKQSRLVHLIRFHGHKRPAKKPLMRKSMYTCEAEGCTYCSKKQVLVQYHFQRNHAEKTLSCSECDKKFAVKKDRDQHMKTHNPEFITCTEPGCERVFKSRAGMRIHVDVEHHKLYKRRELNKQCLCTLCGKLSRNSYDLKTHMNRVHLHVRPYECKTCGRCFHSKGTLYAHEKTHSDTRNHKCDACGKAFKLRQNLTMHLKLHGAKNFACDVCNKSFHQRSSLLRHARIHTGVRPYICHICKSVFNDPSILRRHMLGIHKMENFKLQPEVNIREVSETVADAASGKSAANMRMSTRRGQGKASSKARQIGKEPTSIKLEKDDSDSNNAQVIVYRLTEDGEIVAESATLPADDEFIAENVQLVEETNVEDILNDKEAISILSSTEAALPTEEAVVTTLQPVPPKDLQELPQEATQQMVIQMEAAQTVEATEHQVVTVETNGQEQNFSEMTMMENPDGSKQLAIQDPDNPDQMIPIIMQDLDTANLPPGEYIAIEIDSHE